MTTALVTGAARGLGRSIAIRLAKDGYDVALNDIPAAMQGLEETKRVIEMAGRRSVVCTGDVSKEEDVKNMIQATVQSLGSLDVMVANAGVCVSKTFLETTAEDWDRIFDINVRGTYLCYKYAAQQMIAQGTGGRIVGASSVAGKQGRGGLAAYSSTKWAIRGLTQAVAQEVGHHKINVNAYAPGPIDTDMMDQVGRSFGDKDAFYEQERSETSLGAWATADDIAAVVSYLVGPDSKRMTGQTIIVDAGKYFD